MGRWKLVVVTLLLAGCTGAASESASPPLGEVEQPAAFEPPAAMGAPEIEMGHARVGQAVELSVTAVNAAEPVDYVWRIIAPQGETVLTGQSVSFTPLTPTDHDVRVEVHDAYDRTGETRATMSVGLT